MIFGFTPQHRYTNNSSAEAHRLLVKVYDKATLNRRTCREWLQKFKDSDFGVENKNRSGKPKMYEDIELEELLKEDSYQKQ